MSDWIGRKNYCSSWCGTRRRSLRPQPPATLSGARGQPSTEDPLVRARYIARCTLRLRIFPQRQAQFGRYPGASQLDTRSLKQPSARCCLPWQSSNRVTALKTFRAGKLLLLWNPKTFRASAYFRHRRAGGDEEQASCTAPGRLSKHLAPPSTAASSSSNPA